MRATGNGRADHAHGLLFQRRQHLGRFVREGDKADAEAPNVVFLGCAIHLHRQQVRRNVRQLSEQRFFQAVFKEQAKVGVVSDDNQLQTGIGHRFERSNDFVTFRHRRRIAGRVVREVEQHHGLLLAGGFLRQQRSLQAFAIELTASIVKLEVNHLSTTTHAKGQLVIFPILVGDDQRRAFVGEQVGNDADAVSQGIGHNRVAVGFTGEARIVLEHFFTPSAAQFWLTSRRRIGVDIFRGIGRQGFLNQAQVHRDAFFSGDADGGIEFLGFLARFGRLGKDAFFREINRAAKAREHFQNRSGFRGERVIQLLGKSVHGMSTVVGDEKKRFYSRRRGLRTAPPYQLFGLTQIGARSHAAGIRARPACQNKPRYPRPPSSVSAQSATR